MDAISRRIRSSVSKSYFPSSPGRRKMTWFQTPKPSKQMATP